MPTERRWIRVLSLFGGIAVAGGALGTVIPTATKRVLGKLQTKQRVIARQRSPHEPYQVSDILVNSSKAVEEGKRFDADGDWLANLSFTVKNTSNKGIVFVRVNLAFPESRSSGAIYISQFDIGHSVTDPVKRGEPILLAPGESTRFELSGHKLVVLKIALSRRGYQVSDLTELELQLQTVEFADNSGWFVGDLFDIDPGRRRWTRRPRTP